MIQLFGGRREDLHAPSDDLEVPPSAHGRDVVPTTPPEAHDDAATNSASTNGGGATGPVTAVTSIWAPLQMMWM